MAQQPRIRATPRLHKRALREIEKDTTKTKNGKTQFDLQLI